MLYVCHKKNQCKICTTLTDKLMVSLKNTNLIQNKLDYTYKYMCVYIYILYICVLDLEKIERVVLYNNIYKYIIVWTQTCKNYKKPQESTQK